MYFVNVVNMKIPIIIFICISTSSGSNSSLFESKVLSGYSGDELFGVKYIGYIVKEFRRPINVAAANFINEGNCLVTKEMAIKVKGNTNFYFVESPVFPEKNIYSIDSTFYKDVDDDVAALWGVIKLSRNVESDEQYFNFVNPRDSNFEMDIKYYVGGWHYFNEKPFAKYLTVELSPFEICKNEIKRVYKRNLHNLACGTAKKGTYQKIDVGTGLFLNDKELLGVTVQLPDKKSDYAIFALLYNDVQFILDFVKRKPIIPNNSDKGKGKGKAKDPAESGDVYFERTGGEDTPCLPDTNPQHPSYMDAYDQGQTDRYDLSYIVDHHIGHAGARKKDKMVPYNQNPMSTHYQDHRDASDPGLMDVYGLSHVVAHHKGQAGAWNQDKMGAFNLNPIGTHHRGQTGTYGQGQMDTHRQSEIDSHQPSYMSPQYTSDVDDLSKMFTCSKPIKTRRNQSPDRRQVHDGSHSTIPYRTAFRNPNVDVDNPVFDTSRVLRTKHSENPRSRSKRQKE